MPIRIDRKLRSLLDQGAKQTPHNRVHLIQLTLHRHLREVIAQERIAAVTPDRLTAVSPWPKGALAKAYKRIGKNWDRMEAAASKAQGKPHWKD